MKALMEKLVLKENLTGEEMTSAMNALMTGEVDPILAGSFLTALKMKGETIEEITAAAKVLREKASSIAIDKEVTLDTCGTGGDVSGTFNISTAGAIICAAAGVSVTKHGNRSASSKCGCADVLEELGVVIDLAPDQVKQCVEEIGIGFMFARTFHKSMKHVAPIRGALGFGTVFNILGPLANPAGAKYQLVGVYQERLLDIYAKVLNELGVKRALIVHGTDGLDEITITGETKVCKLDNGEITYETIKPEDFMLSSAPLETIKGGEKELNAQIIRDLFDGKTGPMRDILVLNAGAALYTCGKAKDIAEGIMMAQRIIDEGRAKNKLQEFIDLSQKLRNEE